MKKIWMILAVMLIFISISCGKPKYVDLNGNPVSSENAVPITVHDFCNLKLIVRTGLTCVYVDTLSDVLYYGEVAGNSYGLMPIMKPNGTCLTFSEWKAQRGISN